MGFFCEALCWYNDGDDDGDEDDDDNYDDDDSDDDDDDGDDDDDNDDDDDRGYNSTVDSTILINFKPWLPQIFHYLKLKPVSLG